ncbi:hypothetical protein G7Y89_g9589 [Cudoniella acicularis]|uniref:RING-type E3 ubiquitin transferase n=1 Tax=Cudoniella acicularis TaxID=354080 RepID=A0A8H4W2F6_9HELO|nr:hypothetical protein G7Y89_g9589 [Cudoniella acicularis]
MSSRGAQNLEKAIFDDRQQLRESRHLEPAETEVLVVMLADDDDAHGLHPFSLPRPSMLLASAASVEDLPALNQLHAFADLDTQVGSGEPIFATRKQAEGTGLRDGSACLILINLILFIYGGFMYGLQRLCYGPLRPIEIEQLYEKAWFAITETCLAMTIFREEVGAWFLVMFVGLLTGKVWGWIGDGRVEVLEQQPPANPRLFHIRLTISLTMSIIYDLWLMNYTINTVIQQARPNMMVMFLFEFAILTTCSFATGFRYSISLIEARIVKQQTQERLVERRRQVREERAEILRLREAATASGEANDVAQSDEPLPSEDDVDEMDIEVPGWEAKGQWVLTLDLISGQHSHLLTPNVQTDNHSDFIKLGIYVTFFVILFMFYGLPIHIIRDLYLTARSFTKRLAAFLRYRRATQDMNKRYEDATVDDIQREDTCIICREEMRPWSVTNPAAPAAAPGAAPPARPAASINERSRPKKLPCGHILHLGCLKSWLERQQVCPTCRAPVVDTPQGQAARAAVNNANPAAPGAQPPPPGQQDGQGAPPAAPAVRGAGRGMRMLNFGPLRVGFGQANLQDLAGLGAPQPNQENPVAGAPRVYGLELGFPRRVQPPPQAPGAANLTATSTTLQDHLQQIEQQIVSEIRNLQITQQELQLVQLLQVELARLRQLQNGEASTGSAQIPQFGSLGTRHNLSTPMPSIVPQMQRHGVRPNTAAIPSGSAELPPGVTIPEGWTLLPLQRLDGLGATQTQTTGQTGHISLAGPAGNSGSAPTATTQPDTISPMNGNSNNNLTPTPTINPENHSQASSVDSSDTNAISTPPSVAADQSPSSNVASNTTLPSTTFSNRPALNPLSDANRNPSVLSNWGSSQLFSGPGLTPGNTNGIPPSPSTMPPPPNSGDNHGSLVDVAAHVDGHVETAVENAVGQSPHLNLESSNSDSASSEIGETTVEGEERRREKGKGRAPTVEDTVDEAEGS